MEAGIGYKQLMQQLAPPKNTKWWDLHGYSVEQAKALLEHSLKNAEGDEQLTFVTGRGKHVHPDGRRAVIKNQFREWIETSSFKGKVKSITEHIGHFDIEIETSQKSIFEKFTVDFLQQQFEANLDEIKQKAAEGDITACLMLAEDFDYKCQYKEAAALYKKLAVSGHPAGQYMYANYLFIGRGVIKNTHTDKEALGWYRKAAEQDHTRALCKLAEFYTDGLGDLVPDVPQAMQYYQRAAALGCATGMHNLASSYFYGQGNEQNKTLAFALFKQAADLGDAFSQYMVAAMAQRKEEVEENPSLSFHYYQMSAQQGNLKAKAELGVCYYDGYGVAENKELGIDWLKRAADGGSSRAATKLMKIFSKIGDHDQAYEYLKISAHLGDIGSQLSLPVIAKKRGENDYDSLKDLMEAKLREQPTQNIFILEESEGFYVISLFFKPGTTKNQHKRGITLLNMLADSGCNGAYFELGRLYENHEVIKPNPNQALLYWRKGAEKQERNCVARLGKCYENGFAVKVNKPKAMEYFCQASELGDPQSSIHLANLYDDNNEISLAFKYYLRGCEQIILSLDEVEDDLIKPREDTLIFFLKRIFEIWLKFPELRNSFPMSVIILSKILELACYDNKLSLSFLLAAIFEKESLFQQVIHLSEKNNICAQWWLVLINRIAKYPDQEIYFNRASSSLKKRTDREFLTLPAKIQILIIELLLLDADQTQRAVKLLKCLAQIGNPTACFFLGKLMFSGSFVPQNDREALTYWERGAELGNSDCQLCLAGCYIAGDIMPQDINKALKYYKSAAELNNVGALYDLALYYHRGNYLPLDLKQAIQLYKKAYKVETTYGVFKKLEFAYWPEKIHLGEISCNLGQIYLEGGEGVPANEQLGLKWLEESSSIHKDDPATVTLATYYMHKDFEKSYSLLYPLVVRDKPHLTATFNMFVLCASNPDPAMQAEAGIWLEKAVELGDEGAIRYYNMLKEKSLQSSVEMHKSTLVEAPKEDMPLANGIWTCCIL